jgi:cysteinyl-tRNA synthetase
MPLRLYNTLTRQKEIFEPLDSSNVRLYACGPTVYDHLHIGNGRMLIVFDVLFRLLCHLYGKSHVTYVRNITDVDDKINARAAERGVDIRVLTDEMTKVFHDNAKALGCLPPTAEPHATDHIAEMIALIKMLIAKGHAYIAENHVLFDVPSMPAYGKLSKRPLDEMIAGARVEVAPYKRGPMDFVLWKPSSVGEPGWESPWGRGRPGWHIECSAMSWKHLGEVFDIHGGGIDLLFPHHENEIAQSCSAFGHDVMANYWIHNGHLQVEGEKMAKSLGNFVTIKEVLRGWRGEPWTGSAIRFAMLGTHYRQPIDWTKDRLEDAKVHLQMLVGSTMGLHFSSESFFKKSWESEAIPSPELVAALSDDLNTADAISKIKTTISKYECLDDQSRLGLVHDARFLGLVDDQRRGWLTGHSGLSNIPVQLVDEAIAKFRDYRVFAANKDVPQLDELNAWFVSNGMRVNPPDGLEYVGTDQSWSKIEKMKEERRVARAAKDWATSDRIRDDFAKIINRIAVQDNPDGTTTLHYRLVGEPGRFELRGSAATLEEKK